MSFKQGYRSISANKVTGQLVQTTFCHSYTNISDISFFNGLEIKNLYLQLHIHIHIHIHINMHIHIHIHIDIDIYLHIPIHVHIHIHIHIQIHLHIQTLEEMMPSLSKFSSLQTRLAEESITRKIIFVFCSAKMCKKYPLNSL